MRKGSNNSGKCTLETIRCKSLEEEPSSSSLPGQLSPPTTNSYLDGSNPIPSALGGGRHNKNRRFSFSPQMPKLFGTSSHSHHHPPKQKHRVRLSVETPNTIIPEEKSFTSSISQSSPRTSVTFQQQPLQPEILYHHVFDPERLSTTVSYEKSRRKSLAREAFHALYYINSPPRKVSADFGVFSSNLSYSSHHIPTIVGRHGAGIRKSSSKDIFAHFSPSNSTTRQYSSHSFLPVDDLEVLPNLAAGEKPTTHGTSNPFKADKV